MSQLPQISGRKCVSALKKAGFYVRRQQSSHIILRRDRPFAQTVVPDHGSSGIRVVVNSCGVQSK